MAKRGNKYERIDRDLYQTVDPRAAAALAPHVSGDYVEPCAGKGDLIRILVPHGLRCIFASDIVPLAVGVEQADAFRLDFGGRRIITNPPWRRDLLHPMIRHFLLTASEAWLLFDADWMHTKQASPFERWLTDVVWVGRLQWFEKDDPRSKGMDPRDNCAWYRFAHDKFGATRFWLREG